MLQNTVQNFTPLGLVGEQAFASTTTVQVVVLNSPNEENNCIGHAFTLDSGASLEDAKALTVRAGGEGEFIGILGMPKSYVSPSLNHITKLENGKIAELITSGEIIVATNSDVIVGDIAIYDLETGEISFLTQDSAIPDGKKQIPNASIHFYNVKSGFVAVLKF